MTTVTPLGRTVSVDDWRAFQGDVALKLIYDYTSTYAEHGYRVLRKSIINGSAMANDELPFVLAHLSGLGFAESDYDSAWLTESGYEFVRMHVNQMQGTCPTCGR